jgi:hypothetical protein
VKITAFVSTSKATRFQFVAMLHEGNGPLVSCSFPTRFPSFPVFTAICVQRETYEVVVPALDYMCFKSAEGPVRLLFVCYNLALLLR